MELVGAKVKITITSVFRGENAGCFLQAWALYQKLLDMGNDVWFRGYSFNNYTYCRKLINILKCSLRFKFKRVKDLMQKEVDYRRFQGMVRVADNKLSPELNFFGSDTLWNFDDPYFAQHASFFTGCDIEGSPKFAYSISVGSTPKEKFLTHATAIKSIQDFKGIAVRDDHTKQVLSEIYPAESIVKTVDPTMLLNTEVYLKHFKVKTPAPAQSLVIYYYGTIPAAIWDELRDFARGKGLTIVNVGLHNDCESDISVVTSPANFISAFSNAEYVFTNTFHGCVFSTIFNKPFATDGIQKKKIEGFLEEFSLLDRVVTDASGVETVLTTPVDYERVNALIKEKRDTSVEYLECCMRKVREHE